MTRRNPDWGELGDGTSQAMRDDWELARQEDQARPVPGGRWVPWGAIEVRESILPRDGVDEEAVERYAQVFDELPPITVQRSTLVLIDGLHRLSAAPRAARRVIRTIEVDVADADLEDHAARANVVHGVPLTPSERVRAAQRMFARHHPDTGGTSGVRWTDARIAEWSGVSRRVVSGWLARDRQKVHEDFDRCSETDSTDGRASEEPVQNARVGPAVEPPTARLGADDKWRPVTKPTGAAAVPRPPKPATNGYQNAGALTHTAVPGAVADPVGEDAAAVLWERVLAAVQGIEERDPDAMLEGATPAQASEVRKLANRMVAYWGRVEDAAALLESYAEDAP